MNIPVGLLAMLIGKHFAFDYLLQDAYQFLNKGRYGHPGGIMHAASAALGTFIVFFIWLGIINHGSIEVNAALNYFKWWFFLIVAEGVLHYHVDWLKFQLCRFMEWHPGNSDYYWWVFGFQQMLHQLSYVALAVLYHPCIPCF